MSETESKNFEFVSVDVHGVCHSTVGAEHEEKGSVQGHVENDFVGVVVCCCCVGMDHCFGRVHVLFEHALVQSDEVCVLREG